VNDSVNPPFPSSSVFVFPDSLKGEVGFVEAWGSWVLHRKQIKKPLTGEQAKKQLAAFEQWGPARSIAAIEHTIRQGWQGLREPEGMNGKPVDQEHPARKRPCLNKPFSELTATEFAEVQLGDIPRGRDDEYFKDLERRKKTNGQQ
jgi:hypothetical protein